MSENDKANTVIDLTGDGAVVKEILREGSGETSPQPEDDVKVHYVGTLASDGSKFDSSRDRDDPFVFKLGVGQVIKAWDIGVASMKQGELAIITCQPSHGYGESGSPPKIPANAVLKFEVELLSWSNDKDVFGDGGVVKQEVIETGSGWKGVETGNYCRFNYTVKNANGDVIDQDFSSEVCEVVLGESSTLPAVEGMLKKMKTGETARFNVSAKYASQEGTLPRLGDGNSDVQVEIKLLVHGIIQKLGEDGLVSKKVLTEGTGWEQPTDGASVKYHITYIDESGTSLFSSKSQNGGNPVECTVGDTNVPEAIDVVLREMKEGEVSQVHADKSTMFVFGLAPPAGSNIQEGSDVDFTIEVTDIQKGKESWNLSHAEKIALCTERKGQGNALFKAGNYRRAAISYRSAIKLFADANSKDNEKREASHAKLPCLLNATMCCIKLGKYDQGLKDVNQALEIDGNNVKGLYRRGIIHRELGNFVESHQDFNHVQDLDSTLPELSREIALLKRAEKQQNKRDKKAFTKMFSGISDPSDSAPEAAQQ